MGWDFGMYDVAQICLSGHLINDSTHEFPEANKKFCQKCGKKTITECQDCGYPIRGDYVAGAVVVVGGSHYKVPAYCENCGRPYLWTKAALEEATELTKQLPGLSETEKSEIANNLDYLLFDTAKSKPAAVRVKTLLGKSGGDIAGMLRDSIVDVASETAKKILLG